MIARTVWLSLLITPIAAAQSLFDPNLRVQTYASGFSAPTGVAFINGFGDMLVTQKNDGRVMLVRNRQIVGAALDLPVNSQSERGLLSIAASPNFANDQLVYVFHTAAASDGAAPINNRVSRYRLEGDRLVFNRTIIDLPPGPGPNHDGGKLIFDRKAKLYITIGDLQRQERTTNFENSTTINRIGAILRIQPNGLGIPTNPFNTSGQTGPDRPAIADIYAYGIRNSFGIAFDPLTGNLWDTENGPDRADEINQVSPGFNSGWRDVMGLTRGNPPDPATLESLGPRAFYSEPELTWNRPVAPTDLHFYEGAHLGSDYRHDLFVGDVNTGSLYHFDLTSRRRSLRLIGPLSDYIVNNEANFIDETANIRLGEGFGVITDILSGPGGLFVLSLNGKLYRISQNPGAGLSSVDGLTGLTLVPEPSLMWTMLIPTILAARPRRCGNRAGHRERAARSAWFSRDCRG